MNPFINIHGTKYWRNDNGDFHREDGPAIEWTNGDKEWYIDGKRHREDGPAIEYVNGSQDWYINGILHRLDGPAVIYRNMLQHWYIHGQQINCKDNEEFLRIVKMKELL
jgi:hypothetical protein